MKIIVRYAKIIKVSTNLNVYSIEQRVSTHGNSGYWHYVKQIRHIVSKKTRHDISSYTKRCLKSLFFCFFFKEDLDFANLIGGSLFATVYMAPCDTNSNADLNQNQ